MLEDRQWVMLGGVDMSPTYQLFQTLLLWFWPLICMIWMKLTRTDTVFSRTTLVLFLCRNKSSRNWMKLFVNYFWELWWIMEQRPARACARGPPHIRARPPRPRPDGLCGSRGSRGYGHNCYKIATVTATTSCHATKALLQRDIPGAVELTTQLSRPINILWLPLCRINKLGWNTTREDCRDPLYM